MAIQLASLDDIKEFLEINSSGHDTLLTTILESVSAKIETYLNRSLTEQSYTEYFSGGKHLFYVKAYPIDIGTPPTVTVDDNMGYSDGSEYHIWDEDGLFEFVTAPSSSIPKAVKIVYTGGYAVTSGVIGVPDDLKYACILQTAFEFRRRTDVGLESVTLPDGSVSVPTRSDFIREVKLVMNKHRRTPNRR